MLCPLLLAGAVTRTVVLGRWRQTKKKNLGTG